MRSPVALVLLALTVALPAASAGVGAFDNPGFEDGTIGWTFANVDFAGGWRATGGNPNAMFILNDNGNLAHDPTISQVVSALSPGTEYQVCIDIGKHHVMFGGIVFSILVDGSAIGDFPHAPGYTNVCAAFTASSTSHEIGFAGERYGSDGDSQIDNASILSTTPTPPVPELSTLALLLAGMVVVVFVALRRR